VLFLLIPGGRVFGRGFGFVQGALTMFASALITGGVGPWLPFQMIAAAWVGLLAGCLPGSGPGGPWGCIRGRAEVWMLAAYGFVAGLVYGLVMDMWFWPFGVSEANQLHFVPGAPLAENLRRFWGFHVASALGFDIPRAVGNAVLVLIAGPPVLAALRRAARRAAFDAPVVIEGPVDETAARSVERDELDRGRVVVDDVHPNVDAEARTLGYG
jgi:energy-coupling factor transport system substrate-specific component